MCGLNDRSRSLREVLKSSAHEVKFLLLGNTNTAGLLRRRLFGTSRPTPAKARGHPSGRSPRLRNDMPLM